MRYIQQARFADFIEIRPGLYLCTRAFAIEEQRIKYSILDIPKDFDFSVCPYWLIDGLNRPVGVVNEVDITNYLDRLEEGLQ